MLLSVKKGENCQETIAEWFIFNEGPIGPGYGNAAPSLLSGRGP
jgi:hypothetical protein